MIDRRRAASDPRRVAEQAATGHALNRHVPRVSDQADPRCAAELLWITTGGIPESPGLATIAEAAMPHLTEVRTNGSQRSL
jgi:hypothetical protein